MPWYARVKKRTLFSLKKWRHKKHPGKKNLYFLDQLRDGFGHRLGNRHCAHRLKTKVGKKENRMR